MSLILCIETGTDICSVALSDNGKLISLRESTEDRNHAQNLGVYIEDIFREMDIDADELAAVAVGMGPGSYTGLRVGVSMAKGLCYGQGIPLIAVNSLKAMAQVALDDFDAGILDIETLEKTLLCPMIDARRMEVYTQVFDPELNPQTEIEAMIIDETASPTILSSRPMIVFGNGAAKSAAIIESGNLHLANVAPSARGMVVLAEQSYRKQDFADTAYFEPFYLKDFVVTTSRKNIF